MVKSPKSVRAHESPQAKMYPQRLMYSQALELHRFCMADERTYPLSALPRPIVVIDLEG